MSQSRHWCEYCRIYINGTKQTIAYHENGRKHKEIVETFLRDMRKRGRERRIENDATAKELAKIEREAMKQYQREDIMGHAGAGAHPQLSEERAARLAQLEATMTKVKQERAAMLETAAYRAVLPDGWEESFNPDGKRFYIHTRTGQVQWDRPECSAASETEGAASSAQCVTTEAGGWQQGWTDQGVAYYYNVSKNITQWEVRDQITPIRQRRPRRQRSSSDRTNLFPDQHASLTRRTHRWQPPEEWNGSASDPSGELAARPDEAAPHEGDAISTRADQPGEDQSLPLPSSGSPQVRLRAGAQS